MIEVDEAEKKLRISGTIASGDFNESSLAESNSLPEIWLQASRTHVTRDKPFLTVFHRVELPHLNQRSTLFSNNHDARIYILYRHEYTLVYYTKGNTCVFVCDEVYV